jgi:hypothetical protein
MGTAYRQPQRRDEIAIAARLTAIEGRLAELDRQLTLIRDTLAAGFGEIIGQAPTASGSRRTHATKAKTADEVIPLELEDGSFFTPETHRATDPWTPPPVRRATPDEAARHVAAARATSRKPTQNAEARR